MNKTFDRSMKRHLKKGCIHLAPIERSSSLTEQGQASSSNVGVVAQLWCQFWCLLSVQLNLGLVQLGAVLGKLAHWHPSSPFSCAAASSCELAAQSGPACLVGLSPSSSQKRCHSRPRSRAVTTPMVAP